MLEPAAPRRNQPGRDCRSTHPQPQTHAPSNSADLASPTRILLTDTEQRDPAVGEKHPEGYHSVIGRAGEAAGGGRRAALDQKRENRTKSQWKDPRTHKPGTVILGPNRSGGGFDPLGCRSSDIQTADLFVACVDAHTGRWLMVTLTVDRTRFLTPEAAYQRCNDRVRQVARAVSRNGIHATGFELQGKTGDGWPHWHLVIWAPDDRSLDEITARVRSAWVTVTEHADHDTGEVTHRSVEPIAGRHGIDVTEATTPEGLARYTAKYLLKPWPAVPSWMGESTGQKRKLRLSVAMFDWAERAGIRQRIRGTRRLHRRRRRPARPLFQRMARSATQHLAFVVTEDGKLKFLGTVWAPSGPDGIDHLASHGCQSFNHGSVLSLRWATDLDTYWRLRRDPAGLAMSQRAYRQNLREVRAMWDYEQSRRRHEDRDGPDDPRGGMSMSRLHTEPAAAHDGLPPSVSAEEIRARNQARARNPRSV